MILTVNNDPSKKLDAPMVLILKEQCDDISTFSECGWFCVLGYRGKDRLVNAHCNSRDEYETMMGYRKEANPYDWARKSTWR